MATHRPIRDIDKRFLIVGYHLAKIIQDWGECRGLSAKGRDKLSQSYHSIKTIYDSITIAPFSDSPFIPEEEFDSKP